MLCFTHKKSVGAHFLPESPTVTRKEVKAVTNENNSASGDGRQAPAFQPPNHTQTPNELYDELLPLIDSLAELKVTLAIIRQTFGWHKGEDRLSLSQLETLTGLTRKSVAEGVKSALRRGYVGRRKVDQGYLYGLRVASRNSRPPASVDTTPLTSVDTIPTKERVKEKNDSSLHSLSEEGHSDASSAEKKEAKKEKPIAVGQWGIANLMDRIADKRKSGAVIHSPTERERRSFGEMMQQVAKDGVDDEKMLRALDYMVARAAGEIDGAPRAWVGFRTALDTVIFEDWHPTSTPGMESEAVKEKAREVQRKAAENVAMMEEWAKGLEIPYE